MTKSANALLQAAMKLDVGDRAELAAELLASLEGEPEADVEAAWTAEIRRRVERIECGEEKLVSWTEVQNRVESQLRKR